MRKAVSFTLPLTKKAGRKKQTNNNEGESFQCYTWEETHSKRKHIRRDNTFEEITHSKRSPMREKRKIRRFVFLNFPLMRVSRRGTRKVVVVVVVVVGRERLLLLLLSLLRDAKGCLNVLYNERSTLWSTVLLQHLLRTSIRDGAGIPRRQTLGWPSQPKIVRLIASTYCAGTQ